MVELDLVLVRDFAVALAIGALIGIDREKKSDAAVGGIRTFTLLALAGALSGWTARALEAPLVFAAFSLGVAALIAVSHHGAAKDGEEHGLTTEIAGMATFLLGGTALLGAPEIAVVLGIATSALLAFKQPIHGIVDKIGREDLAAVLKLLFATFIVLPLLPDRTIDPWGAINPQRLWWLVILIAGLSFVGYVGMRALGDKVGVVVTGLLGGLVSSTAVTLTLSRRSRETPALAAILGVGILGAWTVMFFRVMVIVAVVHAPLLRVVGPPLLLAGLALAAIGTLWFLRAKKSSRHSGDGSSMALKNPFSLFGAVKIGFAFAIVLLAIAIARSRWGSGGGELVVAALAGATDVDPVTLSMAEAARGGAEAAGVAAAAILLAVATNTLSKLGMVLALGDRRLKIALGLVTAGLVGLAVASAAIVLRA